MDGPMDRPEEDRPEDDRPEDNPMGGRRTAEDPAPQVFGFFLAPKFSMLCFTSAVEPLRSANRLAGRRLYDWRVISKDGAAVAASNGIEVVPHTAMAEAERMANLFLVAGLDGHLYDDAAVFAWLRRIARKGCRMGALSTGSYALARAGLLQDRRATIHWENLAGFREEFPDIEVTSELFEIDGNRMTCSGGTAGLDLVLSLIGLEHGRELAVKVAEQFIHERIRDNHDQQRMALRSRLGISHPKLLKVIALMEEHLEEPLSRRELAHRAGLSTRQLERLFRRYLARTPTRYYLELRLHRARALLTQTALSVLDVGLACGFVSASHFSKCYREFFQKTPREERLVPA